MKSKRTPTFTGVTSPQLEAFCMGLKAAVMKGAKLAHSRMRCGAGVCTNVMPLTSWALKLYKGSSWIVVETDKDGGFAFLPRELLPKIHERILEGKSMYREVHIGTIRQTDIKSMAFNLMKKIEKLEASPGLAKELAKPLRDGTVCASLRTTCKTHKVVVKFRNIHASPSYALKGLSSWIVKLLRVEIAKYPHLLRDTNDLVKQLANFRVENWHYFIKMDIEEFFNSGLPNDLVEDTAMLIDGEHRRLYKEVLEFVLDNQFVMSKYICNRVFKVCEGSGMGLLHSGDVADAALLKMAEARYAVMPSVMNCMGICKYFRFKDDILVIADDRKRQCVVRFLKEFKKRTKYFKMKVETITHDEVQFLEVVIFKDGQRLGIKPYFKPTAVGIPLSAASAHPVHVHWSWPFALMRRYLMLTSNKRQKKEAAKFIIKRFRMHHSSKVMIKSLKEYAVRCIGNEFPLAKKPQQEKHEVLWITVGFHPAWYTDIKRTVSAYMRSDWSRLLNEAFYDQGLGQSSKTIRIAWKNVLPFHKEVMQNVK